MTMLLTILAAMAAQTATPAPQIADDAALLAAKAALEAHQPQRALDLLAPVLEGYAATRAAEQRRVYCGMSTVETLLYMGMAAKDKQSAVTISPAYCNALFFKGFALVDLDRIADARAVYEQVVALAPMHAHFLTELGQTFRPEKNWPAMLDRCTAAAGAVGLAPDAQQRAEKLYAWHCQGYALSELARLDEAEALYKNCLALDPLDTHARNELNYIARRRAASGGPASPAGGAQ